MSTRSSVGQTDGGPALLDATGIRKAALRDAAEAVERVGQRLTREAHRAHNAENYDEFEDLDSRATLAFHIAGIIRRKR